MDAYVNYWLTIDIIRHVYISAYVNYLLTIDIIHHVYISAFLPGYKKSCNFVCTTSPLQYFRWNCYSVTNASLIIKVIAFSSL